MLLGVLTPPNASAAQKARPSRLKVELGDDSQHRVSVEMMTEEQLNCNDKEMLITSYASGFQKVGSNPHSRSS